MRLRVRVRGRIFSFDQDEAARSSREGLEKSSKRAREAEAARRGERRGDTAQA